MVRGSGDLRVRGDRNDRSGRGRCAVGRPDRRATRSTLGVSLEVTRRGQLQLATALGPDDLYVARIHSHPGEAFHSPADDANPGAAAGLGAETSGETLDEAGRTRRRRCPPVPLRLHCPALTHEARCAAAAAVAPLLTDMPQEPHHDNGRDGATA